MLEIAQPSRNQTNCWPNFDGSSGDILILEFSVGRQDHVF